MPQRRQNLRKIPPIIANKLRAMKSQTCQVGTSKVIPASTIIAGRYRHLGITLSSGGLSLPSAIIPAADAGRYSTQNAMGYDIIRRDLPKRVSSYTTVEVPNYGDWTLGSHDVDIPHYAYPREHIAPTGYAIELHCRDPRAVNQAYIVSFRLDAILDRFSPSFDDALLYCLNILQENVGACDVHEATVPIEEYDKSLHVAWELLPPGSLEQLLVRLFRHRPPSPQERETIEDRHAFLMTLNPKRTIVGTSGFARYYGALLQDDLVVFENAQYGNAIYIMYSSWESLSQRTRMELLSGRYGSDFARIVHSPGWKARVNALLNYRRRNIA